MNCNNCKVEISPEWNYCIKMNACPSCGKRMFSEKDISIMNLFTEHCKMDGELDFIAEKVKSYRDKDRTTLPVVKSFEPFPTSPVDVFDNSQILFDNTIKENPKLNYCSCGITMKICKCKK